MTSKLSRTSGPSCSRACQAQFRRLVKAAALPARRARERLPAPRSDRRAIEIARHRRGPGRATRRSAPAPPSTRTRVIPAARCASTAARSRPARRSPCATRTISTPSAASVLAATLRGGENDHSACFARCAQACDDGESRSRVSSTTRTGERCSSPGRRQVRSGSSASTVPMPIRIASCCARSRWPKRRAALDVIHLLSPVATRDEPSALSRDLQRDERPSCATRIEETRIQRARFRFAEHLL